MLYVEIRPNKGSEIFKNNCIVNVNGYFNRVKKKEWFNRDDVRRIIKGIDNTNAIKDEYLESPVFGGMSPERLSGGCKAVILMAVLDKPYIYGTRCGDNCASYILDIAKSKDIYMALGHCMIFPEIEFEITIVESNKIVHNREEFIYEYYNYQSSK